MGSLEWSYYPNILYSGCQGSLLYQQHHNRCPQLPPRTLHLVSLMTYHDKATSRVCDLYIYTLDIPYLESSPIPA